MPLPIRTAARRKVEVDREAQRTPSHSQRLESSRQLRKPTLDHAAVTKIEIPPEGEDSSAASTRFSSEVSQSKSRIPSPFKQSATIPSNHNAAAVSASRPVQQSGHSRQRSAVLPPSNARPKPGHARSASIVSSTTTASNLSLKPTSTKLVDPQNKSATANPTKTRLVSRQQIAGQTDILTTTGAQRESHPQFNDRLANEYLQLTVVNEDASKSLSKYASSVETCLAQKQSEVDSIRATLLDKQNEVDAVGNICALDDWLQAHGRNRFCQVLQDFSIAVSDLSQLTQILNGADGLAQNVRTWCNKIASIRNGRSGSEIDQGTISLDHPNSLQIELERFLKQVTGSLIILESMPRILADSSLYDLIQQFCKLGTSLAAQCHALLRVLDNSVSTCKDWINGEVQDALLQQRLDTPVGRLPAWSDGGNDVLHR